jgi:formyltetrahydrofolate synthetase
LLSSSDTPAELELIRAESLEAGADGAVVSNHWAKGGDGAKALAEAVVSICEGESNFKYLYDLDTSIEDKINAISKNIYGADGIELSDLARTQVDTYTKQGFSNLPSESKTLSLRMFCNTDVSVSKSLHGQDTIFFLTRCQTERRSNWYVFLLLSCTLS